MWFRTWLLPATLLQGIFASNEVSMDPLSNLRPGNINGLIYYLYRWTGSYYNGTTTIRLQPQDYLENTECDTFAPGPIVVSYNNSLLAVTQSNGYLIKENDHQANRLAFSLKFWDARMNILPDGNMNEGPVKDIQEISSVVMNKEDKPDDPTAAPFWKLIPKHDAPVSYSFTGYRHPDSPSQPIRFNYTQCASPWLALYNGTLLPARAPFSRNITITAEPTVYGTFNNRSATLEIKGIYQGKSERGSFLGGNMTIMFNGTIDEARSDRLLSNSHGMVPVWESTLGYERTLTGEKPEAQVGSGRTLGVGRGWMVGIVTMIVVCGL